MPRKTQKIVGQPQDSQAHAVKDAARGDWKEAAQDYAQALQPPAAELALTHSLQQGLSSSKMQYRPLGKTGMDVSVIGLGGVQLGASSNEYAVRIVQRALDLGVNYIDTARVYGDSEIKVGLALQGQRERAYVSTKAIARGRDEAWVQINQSLERLQMDYVDNLHLHSLFDIQDLDQRLGPGGALEAFMRAKEQGMLRHIGCTSHRSSVLIEALKRFDFEIISVPMNLIEREPLDELIPLCQQKGVGVTIMKPLATGLLPARLALKWLASQSIATAVPGCTTIEEIEENAPVGHIEDISLTSQKAVQAEALRAEWEHLRCRLCGECLPCPQGIPIHDELGSDDVYDHYRTMGRQVFAAFNWSRQHIVEQRVWRPMVIAQIESCDRCGICEARCPYGLPVMDLLAERLPAMRDMVSIYQQVCK
jgi:predicted aldo/keto reductase-like oxidoreductase